MADPGPKSWKTMNVLEWFAAVILGGPLIVIAGILSPIIPPVPQSTRATVAMAPPRRRGRLILLAVDETSLGAVQWTISNMLSCEDWVHVVHVLEGDEDLAAQEMRFTRNTSLVTA